MANQLSMAQVHTIESLHKAGYSNRRIAQTLGVDRGTVNKHVRSLNSHRAEKTVVVADRRKRTSPPFVVWACWVVELCVGAGFWLRGSRLCDSEVSDGERRGWCQIRCVAKTVCEV